MRVFNQEISLLRFTIPLKFPNEDKEKYPWLANQDRYYLIEEPLGQGGYSLAFRGFPADSEGRRIASAESVVIKVPNLMRGFGRNLTNIRRRYVEEQSIVEWALIRNRLRDCRHANPIFDLGSIWVEDPLYTELFVTVQPLLAHVTPLRQWLVDQSLRAKVVLDEKGTEKPWGGIATWGDWLRVSSLIVKGLADIHKRRVVHADIWPPNIFITNGVDPYPIFIDFGESFLVMPNGEPRTQPDHSYRAPERERPEPIKTEQVDVYSFGKLMLYLAIGAEEIIPRTSTGQCLYGHKRRNYVRDVLFAKNPLLAKDHPELLDLIMQCVEVDPVARPTMLEIGDQLEDLLASRLDAESRRKLTINRIGGISSRLRCGVSNDLFIRLVDRKIVEAERLLESCETEMIELNGTRDDLIAGMVTLFDELAAGDSWTTLTTPPVWQRNALGLDGRYATATIHAIRRGAAVQRAYAVSIEELGMEWVGQLIPILRSSESQILKRVAKQFAKAMMELTVHADGEGYRPRSQEYQRFHQQRFTLVLNSICTMLNDWKIAPAVHRTDFAGINSTTGFFIGLTVVSTETQIQRLRMRNPASLMYRSKESGDHNKWLLVMTDIRGRNEDEPMDERPAVNVIGVSHGPQLRRVRVYKSVMGVPEDRMIALEELMRESINLGSIVEDLTRAVSLIR